MILIALGEVINKTDGKRNIAGMPLKGDVVCR
jgi:hypothetical protein